MVFVYTQFSQIDVHSLRQSFFGDYLFVFVYTFLLSYHSFFHSFIGQCIHLCNKSFFRDLVLRKSIHFCYSCFTMPEPNRAGCNYSKLRKICCRLFSLFESDKYPCCNALLATMCFRTPTRTNLISAQLDFNSIKKVSMKNLTRILKVYLLLYLKPSVLDLT